MIKLFRLFLLVLLTCTTISTFSQAWQVSWENQYGNRKADFYTDVIEDQNTGYAVLGSTITTGNSNDFWLVKYSANGDTLWTKKIGTKNKDIPEKITQTTDGGYLLMGSTKQEDGTRLFLIKTDNDGKESWRKIFNEKNYRGNDIIALAENDFAIVGGTGIDEENSQLWMAKFDANGTIVSEKIFEEGLTGWIKSIKKLPDGGYAMAGQTNDANKQDCDAIVFRLDKNASQMWSSRISSPGIKMWPECICCSPDSCFILAGWQGNCLNDIDSDDPVFDYDMVVNKLDCNGKVLWTKNFDREGSEGGNAITIRPDGDFIVAGIKATSFTGQVGPWLIHLSTEGEIKDEKLIPFHFNNDHAIKVINTSDGGFVVIGPGVQEENNLRSNGWIMKFASL